MIDLRFSRNLGTNFRVKTVIFSGHIQEVQTLMRIISATPGPTTTERILELIITHPNGIMVKELSNQLNRPVSMINHCLKCLTASKKVCARLSDDGKQWVYSGRKFRGCGGQK